MKTRRILLWALCGLCFSGCKSNKINQELLERELRCQENRIYELEDALDQCEAELEYARRDSSAAPASRSSGGRSKGSSNLPIIDLPDGSNPPRSRGRAEPDAEPMLPTVEPGVEVAPPSASLQPEPRDRHVARIVLNKQLTGGVGQLQGGEQGIVVVFEPRNSRGEMVGEPGQVSIALVDPAQSGPQARLARWDFAPQDAFSQFRRSGANGRGYAFELPWPEAAPANKNLQLFVRYVTPDGRKLTSDMMVNVDPSEGQQAQRWRKSSGAADRDDSPEPGPLRRLLSRSSPERAVADSEAPRYAGSTASANETAALPKLDSGEDEEADEEEDRPAPRKRRPTSTARRADDNRPSWSPYR